MRVQDVMSKRVVSVAPDETLASAIGRMVGNHVSGVPVLDRDGALVGVLSEGDLLRRVELGTLDTRSWLTDLFRPGHQAKVYARTHGCMVHHLMSRNPRTIEGTARLEEAVRLMEEHRIKRLPVMGDGRVVGIITRADFVKALASLVAAPYEEPATHDAGIEAAILAELDRQPWASAAAIVVAVQDRLVTVSGGITDERQRGAIEALAAAVPGVRSVDAAGLAVSRSADLPESVIARAERW